jgi:hypothetical protein
VQVCKVHSRGRQVSYGRERDALLAIKNASTPTPGDAHAKLSWPSLVAFDDNQRVLITTPVVKPLRE